MDFGLLIAGVNSLDVMNGIKLVTKEEYLALEKSDAVGLRGPISLNAVHSTTFQGYLVPQKIQTDSDKQAVPVSVIKLFVMRFMQTTTELLVNSDSTVERVKEELYAIMGVPVDQQRLVFGGEELEDYTTLQNYNIQHGATVHLVLKLRGGGFVTYYFNPDQLHPEFHYDFTNVQDKDDQFDRGGKPYERPCGWKRYALKVVDKYDGGGNTWLGENGIRKTSSPGEWPVSYHGTNRKAAKGIAESGYKLGSRFLYGKGIYSTPSVDCAAQYAQQFDYNGEKYLLILQNRVHPDRLDVIPKSQTCLADYFITAQDDIRPYGLCIKKNT